MLLFSRQSQPLIKSDHSDAKRDIYLESISPVKFCIHYHSEEAIKIYDESSAEFLPVLPWGYHWEKMENQYGVYKLNYADQHEITLVLYGPDENKINYNLLVDGNNYYTLSHTRDHSQKRLTAKDRSYPNPIKADGSGYTMNTIRYMPGHCVDHVDSIIPVQAMVKYGKDCCSSFNSHNYIPEIQKDYWGLYMRKELVAEQRKNKLSYAQLVEYPNQPRLTSAGVAIPESLYFFRLDAHYNPQQTCWIDWSKSYNAHKKLRGTKMVEHMQQFSTSSEAAPRPLVWDVRWSDRDWRKIVRDKRLLGHSIRKKDGVESFNSARDQLYAYGDASTLEYLDSYSSISTALAASSQQKVHLTVANLNKAVHHGAKLKQLDSSSSIIDRNRLMWVKQYHEKQRPGFENESIVDAIQQLTLD